jgi:hypothetical protein
VTRVPQDPLQLGLVVASLAELLDGAVQRSRDRLSVRLAHGSILLLAVRRSGWRTPALAAATLSATIELGVGVSTRADAGRPPATRMLLGLRTLALSCLLQESARVDRWARG